MMVGHGCGPGLDLTTQQRSKIDAVLTQEQREKQKPG